MNFKWTVETGYICNIPDFEGELWIEDLVGMSDDEIEDYVHEAAHEEFSQTISYSVTNMQEVIDAVREIEAEEEA